LLTTTEQLFRGQGCSICGKHQAGQSKKILFDEFQNKSNKVHDYQYKYCKDSYIGYFEKTKIECKEHGFFFQQPNAHLLQRQGCPECGFESQIEKRKMPLEEFIKKANLIHSRDYDYSLTKYINQRENVIIICPKHGEFESNAGNHLTGSGCPNCNISKGENLIRQILLTNDVKFEQQHTFKKLRDKRKLKCDFYLPDYNLVIEFNGRQHYEPINTFGGRDALKETQRRDQIKREYLKDNDMNLLEINYKNNDVEGELMKYIYKLKKIQ